MINKFLAANQLPPGGGGNDPVGDVFGKITPAPGMLTFGDNAVGGFTNLLTTGIKLFIFALALATLAFLLWGAMDWILSGGDKDKLTKAQSKITNAIIGFVLVFVLLAVFGLITGDVLGILKRTDGGGWSLILPTLGN
jgi:hypothetical protein